MDYEEFVESAFEYGQHEYQIINLFRSYIQNAKQLGLDPAMSTVVSRTHRRKHTGSHCARPFSTDSTSLIWKKTTSSTSPI